MIYFTYQRLFKFRSFFNILLSLARCEIRFKISFGIHIEDSPFLIDLSKLIYRDICHRLCIS